MAGEGFTIDEVDYEGDRPRIGGRGALPDGTVINHAVRHKGALESQERRDWFLARATEALQRWYGRKLKRHAEGWRP